MQVASWCLLDLPAEGTDLGWIIHIGIRLAKSHTTNVMFFRDVP